MSSNIEREDTTKKNNDSLNNEVVENKSSDKQPEEEDYTITTFILDAFKSTFYTWGEQLGIISETKEEKYDEKWRTSLSEDSSQTGSFNEQYPNS
eukprot:gene5845-9668_t